jgi:hypothetical protein
MVNKLDSIHLASVNPNLATAEGKWRARQIKKLEKEINVAVETLNSLTPGADVKQFKKMQNAIKVSIASAESRLHSLKNDKSFKNYANIEKVVSTHLHKIHQVLDKQSQFFKHEESEKKEEDEKIDGSHVKSKTKDSLAEYSDIGQDIERFADLIAEDGSLKDPHDFEAVIALSDGKNRQQIMTRIWQGFNFVQEHQWLKSTDPIKQLQVHNLAKLMRYYAGTVEGEDRKRIEKALLSIYKERAGGFKNITELQLLQRVEKAKLEMIIVPEKIFSKDIDERLFDHFEKDLAEIVNRKNPDSPTDIFLKNNFQLMSITLKQCREMFFLLKILESPVAEKTKLARLKNFTMRSGGEEGSFSDKSTEAARYKMASFMGTLITTYKRAKETGKLKEFFSCVKQGCLDGRMQDVTHFMTQLEGISVKRIINPETHLHLISYTMAEMLAYEIFPDDAAKDKIFINGAFTVSEGQVSFNGEINVAELREFLSSRIGDLIAQMGRTGTDAFLEYLDSRRIYDKDAMPEPDWSVLIPAFINHDEAFAKACSMALEMARGLFYM